MSTSRRRPSFRPDGDSLRDRLQRRGLNELESETPDEAAVRRWEKYVFLRDLDAPGARDSEESAVTGLRWSAAAPSITGKRGAKSTNKRYSEACDFCVTRAKSIWSNGTARMGSVCDQLWQELDSAGLYVPATSLTIRRWLSGAARAGELSVPSEARRAGRPATPE